MKISLSANRFVASVSFAVLLYVAASVCHAKHHEDSIVLSKALAEKVQPLIDAHDGDVGVMIKDLKSGATFQHQAEKPMPTASLIKFPLMIAAYKAIEEGELDLEKRVTMKEEDKVPGSGILTEHFEGGTELSLNNVIHLMMSHSDNTATNLVIDQVGLPATAKLMESLDCPNTKLHSKVYRRDSSIFPERSNKFGLGSTTAAEMIKLLETLHEKKLVSEKASEQMIEQMSNDVYPEKFPKLLPPEAKVMHKTGSVNSSRTDAGIIVGPHGPMLLCVLTNKNEDKSWGPDNAGDMLCSYIAKEVYDLFNQGKEVKDSGDPILRIGANGLLVESLQRTLNSKLPANQSIGVDGDFGPATQQAVIRFQEANNLSEKGVVGPETWKALGTLVEENDPGAPEVINAQKIEKQPADDLKGPPFVTAKAWAIGDGKTGELLWGHQAEKPLDMASTTKIMTGYVVTSFIDKNPDALNEIVTFSKRADETSGSSARVRQGEKLSVDELLYGLLLPSGNDASVALAEHFGSRVSPDGETSNDPLDQFIAAMNQTAKELGMTNSQFKNTHGLTAAGHHTSTVDLLKLASSAMRQPLFKKYVGTVQHGCTVVGPGGYKRNLKWNNTNRLLKIEGFGGVKTGTTSAAGSCLVSEQTQDGKSLMVVVLGSTSTDARYTDSKNLYRWARKQLASKQP
ncbi:MAG: serine hydrolase [Lacipirellulaceae bacterium]